MSDALLAGPHRFTVGRTVVCREVLHGLPWLEYPVTVVHDDDDGLAVLLEPGAAFTTYEHPFGPHPWSGQPAWAGTSVLRLQRDGDFHGAWKFFDAEDAFMYWYVNFQEPLVRHVEPGGGGAFEMADLGIDIVIAQDGSSWQWKDADDPQAMVTTGRISQSECDRVLAEAAAVAARIDAGTRWWAPWDDWAIGDPSPEPATT